MAMTLNVSAEISNTCSVIVVGNNPFPAKCYASKQKSLYLVQSCQTKHVCKTTSENVKFKSDACEDSPASPVAQYEGDIGENIMIKLLRTDPTQLHIFPDGSFSKESPNQSIAISYNQSEDSVKYLAQRTPKNIKYLFTINEDKISAYKINGSKFKKISPESAIPMCK